MAPPSGDVAASSLELSTSSVQELPSSGWCFHGCALERARPVAKAVAMKLAARTMKPISHDECRAGKSFQPFEFSRCIRSLRQPWLAARRRRS
jgi:hypothetical protein